MGSFQPGCEVDHSPLNNAKIKKMRSYASIPAVRLHDVDRDNFTIYLHYRCCKTLLTLLSRVPLEKLTGSQLVKKFLTFYGT
jgi:hypothetical protein